MAFNEKMFAQPNSPTYKVTYYVFHKTDKKLVKSVEDVKKYPHIERKSDACFSNLSSTLTSLFASHNSYPNRILFMVDFNRRTPDLVVDEKIRKWWITTCKKNKLFPKYIGKTFADTGRFLIRVGDLDIRQMYTYLTTARNLQDEPHFVRAIYHLVKEKGMDFFVAYVMASKLCIAGGGHHLINVTRHYNPSQCKANSLTSLNIRTGVGLYRFVNKHKAEFTPKQFKVNKKSLGDFRYQTHIEKLGKSNTCIKSEEFLSTTIGE